jgi:hypothetical protein
MFDEELVFHSCDAFDEVLWFCLLQDLAILLTVSAWTLLGRPAMGEAIVVY